MTRTLSAALIMLMLLPLALLCACGGNDTEMPKQASDEEVLAMWDEYPVLAGVPRYSRAGILDNFYTGEDGNVVVSFFGVSAEDFIAYTDTLQNEGFVLMKDSSVWMNEGVSGVPSFSRDGKTVSLIWYMNGGLDVSVEDAG